MRQVVGIVAEHLSKSQMDTLRRCVLFTGCSEATLLAAVESPQTEKRRYRKDELIYAGRQFERSLGILLSGRISVTRATHDGRGMQISTQRPGALFGAAVLFCDAEEFATQLHCDTVCEVLLIPEACFLELMRSDFQLAEQYIRYLSGRIQFLNARIAGLSAGDSEHRLACWLLEHSRDNQVQIQSMTRLASELNIGRASLYRAMEALEQDGTLSRDGHTITICQPHHLSRIRTVSDEADL